MNNETPSLLQICSTLTLGGLESQSLSPEEEQFIRAYQPSGVTLFSRNLEDPNELLEPTILTELKKCLPKDSLPYIFAIDQEGGTVARIKHPKADPGPSLFLAKEHSDQKALLEIEGLAENLGNSLLTCGFNVDFAPSVDITSSPNCKECAINTRSFGYSADHVIARAGAFLKGLQKKGIKGCLKHFPGLGGIPIDTHFKTANAPYSREELESKHLLPYKALLEQSSLVLVSHSIYPALDCYEATRSQKIITQLLRNELGFKGLVVSDDLMMHAVTGAKSKWEDYILQSISAGCDLLLICKGLKEWKIACDVIRLEAEKNPAFKNRVLESYERIQRFRKQLRSC